MPDRKNPLAARLAVAVLCLFALLAAGLSSVAYAAGETSPVLRRVETKKVCMVNDQVFAKDQIPVQVDGKTYYGCCEMCKERLAKDVAARTGTDPVTGKKVDKATAVIVAQTDDSVLYFESEATLAKYQQKK